MQGRPLMIEPVLKNACAVSWLICSVLSERTTQRSSATLPMCGKMSVISVPLLPQRLNSKEPPRALSTVFWSCAICWPFVNDSGKGWPSSFLRTGLLSKSSRWGGPPAMQRKITRLAFTGRCGVRRAPLLQGFASGAAAKPLAASIAKAAPPRP